jgi:hypothetical protein
MVFQNTRKSSSMLSCSLFLFQPWKVCNPDDVTFCSSPSQTFQFTVHCRAGICPKHKSAANSAGKENRRRGEPSTTPSVTTKESPSFQPTPQIQPNLHLVHHSQTLPISTGISSFISLQSVMESVLNSYHPPMDWSEGIPYPTTSIRHIFESWKN